MNWLKNKAVVAALGCAALLLVLFNLGVLGKPQGSSVDPGEEVGAGRTELPPPKNVLSTSPGTTVITNDPMDLPDIQKNLARWVTVPKRDPFRHFTAQDGYAGAGAYLTLSAVWRQTGSRLAVINQKVLEEGDTIDNYRLERIEGERVWAHGPVGLEPLDLELVLTEALHQLKLTEMAAQHTP